ncbi:MAG: FAD-dependent oxidoreductase [Puniceicoccales bacterium]
MQFSSKLIRKQCVVIGGGSSGYGAALAAQRGGASVLLADRHGYLGGMGTAAGLSCYLNHHSGTQNLSGAIYREFVRNMHVRGMHYYDPVSQGDFFEPEGCKVSMENTFLEAGGECLFHVILTSVEKDGDEWLLAFAHKGGSTKVRCRYLIDTSGDGDACALAGAEMTHGRRSDGKTQPMSMVVQLGGFDPQVWEDTGLPMVNGKYAVAGDHFGEQVSDARQKGLWTIPRNEIAMVWSMPSDPTRVTINGTRINGLNACLPKETTLAEIEGRRQAEELCSFFVRYVPGFSRAYLLQTGPQIGVRESRRIIGRTELIDSDVRDGRIPESSVTLCCYPIDVHNPEGSDTQFEMTEEGSNAYGIAWECLLPKGIENLAAAGRCISATHEAAGSFRVMPTCMTLGEAAGTAVALANKKNRNLSDISGIEIRQVMEASLVDAGEPGLSAIYESANSINPVG